MVRLLYKAFTIIVFTVFVLANAKAQTVCSEKLLEAKQLFESGQIEQIPSLLDSCLEKGFTSEEKVIAYHLLIQTYLFDYNQAKADETMIRFLKEFPTYSLRQNDPAEIKELFEAFESRSVWGFEVMAGGNMSHLITDQYYSTYDLLALESSNPIKFGFNAGLQVSRYFGSHFAASMGVKYVNSNYQNVEKHDEGGRESRITEHTQWIAAPVLGYWYVNVNRKFSPFVFAGMEFSYVLNSKVDFRTKYGASGNDQIVKGTGIDLTKRRNQFQYGVSGGLGAKYRLPGGSFKLWAGYTYNLNSFAKAGRYDDMDIVLYYQHIDDKFFYNHISVNISYSLDLYRIRKK